MYPIASATVSGTSTTSVNFSGIPQNFSHLHLRCFVRTDRVATGDNLYMRFNNDTASNYNFHYMQGSGSATVAGQGSAVSVLLGVVNCASNQANDFALNIVDVLDYTNTNKYKVIKNLVGCDTVGAGSTSIWSGVWISTAAISTFNIVANVGNFTPGTRFDLYGISTSNATGA
jgi:hypothetical protein